MTISAKTIQQVQYLLATTTLSQRQIALRAKVSYTTVSQVVNGKRKPRPIDKIDKTIIPVVTGVVGSMQRCPICGALVQMPCYACHVRKLKPKSLPQVSLNYTTKLQLEDDDNARYERRRHRSLRLN